MNQLHELKQKLQAKRAEAAEFLAAHKTTDAERPYAMTPAEIEDLSAKRAEIDEIAAQVKTLDFVAHNEAEIKRAERTPSNPLQTGDPANESKSIGERLIDTGEFKAWEAAGRPANFKATMSTSSGLIVPINRIPGVTGAPLATQNRVFVQDLIPKYNTDTTDIRFIYESTLTNSAAETNEAGTVAESTIVTTEGTSAVRTIAHLIPVTEQQYASAPQLMALLNNRMPLGINVKLERQIIQGTGTGTPTQLLGILNEPNKQTYAKTADDTVFDALLKGQTKVRNSGDTTAWDAAEPNGCIMHPNDWQDIVLTRTPDGLYILGNPGAAPLNTIWGMVPVVTPAAVENTCVCGDFNFTELWGLGTITVEVGYNSTDFGTMKRSIRAYQMVALAIRRGAAFVAVTGI